MSDKLQPIYPSDILSSAVDLYDSHPGQSLITNLRTHGFAILDNHEVPVHLLKDIFEQWKIFFSSKSKYNWLRSDKTDEGFIPINFESAKKDELADYKELYQTHYNGQFPNDINIKSTKQLFDAIVKLGEKIINLLDTSLPYTIKNEMCMPLPEMVSGSYNHLIRIIHYPPTGKVIKVQRAAPHTDICLFTIVFGEAFPGVEFKNHDGSWYEPVVDKTSIAIFNSEMLEICTNGYLKAVVHRVKVDPNSYTDSRYSIPFGFHPLRQALLKNGLTAIDYLRHRLNEMGYGGNLLDINN